MRPQLRTAMTMESTVFQDVTQCSLVKVYRFGERTASILWVEA
jgi:hypothetical protein